MKLRRGLTLMELIVALGLSVALMVLVGSSLQFYASTLQNRDEQVRRATIARAVMSMITADLRASLWIEPQDLSVATQLFVSANSMGAVAGLSGGSGAAGGASSSAESGAEDPATSETTDETLDPLSYSITERPGLIGSTTQIQFDVSRLPRIDQMEYVDPYALPTEMTDVPSDIKTISYLIQVAGMTGVRTPLGTSPSDQAEGGLVRRVLDREASKYANEVGDLIRLSQTGTLIAPEVLGIEFEYWDGTLWQYSWHSDDMQGLPLAVKVRLIMEPEAAQSAEVLVNPDVYETIVRLPMASAASASGSTSESGDTSSGAESGTATSSATGAI